MDLQPMVMDKSAAEAAFKEYRAAFMAERNRIDGELMRGYKALKEGKQLIELSKTIAAGGEDERHLPRLAFGRADEREIQVYRWREGSVQFEPSGGRIRARDRWVRLPDDTLPRTDDWVQTHFAMVPLIPPRFRPPHALTGYHILWEAEWSTTSRTRAPRDPALLKHIGGDLYAVLAVWDLTDLERAVLEMRSDA